MKELGRLVVENIRKIIALRNLKQAAVGDFAGISESQFSRVLSGSVQLSLNQLADIASGLKMRVIDIITYPDVYVKKEEREEDDDAEVLLQLKVRKEKKEEILKLVFGENFLEVIDGKI